MHYRMTAGLTAQEDVLDRTASQGAKAKPTYNPCITSDLQYCVHVQKDEKASLAARSIEGPTLVD